MKKKLLIITFIFCLCNFKSYSQIGYQFTASKSDIVTSGDIGSHISNINKLTVEFWAKTTPNSNVMFASIYVPGSGGTTEVGGFGLYQNTMIVSLSTAFGQFSQSSDLGTTLSTVGWHHFAYVYDGVNWLFYIDGISKGFNSDQEVLGGNTPAYNTYGTTQLKIGGLSPGTNLSGVLSYFDGSMDDFRVWNTARTQSQISASRANELTGSETGLVLYYKLNEPSGQVVTNSTSYSLNGVLGASSAVETIDPVINQTGIVTTINANQAPTNILLSATAINENVAANSTVGTLSSADADSGNTFTYILVAGTGSTDNTSFNISGDNLRITASPDFETKSSYSIRVKTTDQGGLTFEKQFTISINDLAEGVLLSSSPTLKFTSNSAAITGDNIASDGEGGSQAISDIDIQIYNISDVNGTFAAPLSWENNAFMSSSSTSYSGLTNKNNAGSKGMAIKSADGSEFKLNQFEYYNWGETSTFTNTIKGYKNGNEVASTTFVGYDSNFDPQTVTLNSDFGNVDEVRFYITSGGYLGNQSATNHSINSIKVGPAVVSTPAIPIIAQNPPNRTICSGGNTTFSIAATGATSYQWQQNTGSGFIALTNGVSFSGVTTSTLTITGATATMSEYQYRCVATNSSGSATSNKATLRVLSITVNTVTKANVECYGDNNGSATLSASGGIAPYTYSWAPSGGTASNASGLAPGTYTVTVTDNITCSTTHQVVINGPTVAFTATPSTTAVSCFGGSNGTATISPTGGTPGYTYSWSPSGGTAATATGLSAGTYTVTVTDANLCQTTCVFTITQPTALIAATGGGQTDVSCNGGANGTATVAPTGGTPGYTYSWSPSGGTAATATGLSAGTYTVTVKDANNCTATRVFTITQPTALNAAIGGGQTDVSCNGGSNGTATVAPTGGTPGYTYSWSPSGGNAATASGLSAGTYTVTVTDANSCQTTRTFTINQPAAALSAATGGGKTDVSCNGGSNGTATVAPTGGTPAYTYSWSPSGGTGATASGLAAGTYTVTVTDANLCQTTRVFTIIQPTALIAVTGGGQTNVSCNGGANGTATVAPTGGTPGYTYSWSPSGGTAATATGLSAGTYTVTVKDANNCTATRVFTITQPTALIAATGGGQTNVSCNGGANGTATVAPTGGTPGYTYSWSPSGGTAATASGLTAGTYTVTVTDANLCQTTRVFTITQPTAIVFTTTTLPGYDYSQPYSQSISTTGGTGGKTYTVTTGILPTGFSLSSSGIITGTSTQVANSNFTITATDANNCVVSKSFELKLNQIPITVTANASQTKVYGNNDPTLTYTVTPNLLSGDTFSGALSRAIGTNIGNYAINAGTLSAGPKYLMTFVSKDFAIIAKPITVTAVAKNKTYGGADPALTYTFAPALITGDAFAGSLTRSSGENAGTYPINQGTLALNANYTLTYVGADFAITKANQTITWNQALRFGCEGETTVVLTATSDSGLPVSYTSSNSNLVSVSGNSLNLLNYGSVAISASQLGNNNYNPAVAVVLPLVNSQPNLIRKQFENIIFFDNSSKSFSTYTWYKDGVLVPSQTNQYFKENGPLNGTYYAVATKLDGTLVTTCPIVLSPTVEDEHIKIVPNPVKPNASYELLTNVSSSKLQNARIEVYSVAGVLLENKTTSQNTVSLKAPTVEGIYIIKMTLANGKYFTKNLLVKN